MEARSTAILAVSFGTTVQETLQRNIAAVEAAIAQEVPNARVFRAFTSSMVRRILEGKGVHVPSPREAAKQIHGQGFDSLVVVPTHILAGSEYEKAVTEVLGPANPGFSKTAVAKPLLFDARDHRCVLEALAHEAGTQDDEALVLMGHGTCHPIDVAYAALNFEASQMGLDHVFVGTVEGSPTVEDTIRRVKQAGFGKACLMPLMLVAGNHARVDMAGDGDDSWKSRFEAQGVQTRCLIRGLGESRAVRDLYAAHAREAACEVEDAR